MSALAPNTYGIQSRSARPLPRVRSQSRSAQRVQVVGLDGFGADLRDAADGIKNRGAAAVADATAGIVKDARRRMAARPRGLAGRAAMLIQLQGKNTIAYGARGVGWAMGMEFGAGRRTSTYRLRTPAGPRIVTRTMDYAQVFGRWTGNRWTPGFGPDMGVGYAVHPAVRAAAERMKPSSVRW